jgi:hypothetical protein
MIDVMKETASGERRSGPSIGVECWRVVQRRRRRRQQEGGCGSPGGSIKSGREER